MMIKKSIQNKITKVRNFIADDLKNQPTDEDLKIITRHKNYFMAFFYQYALGAIVAGFAVQPLIKFTNPIYYMFSGFFLSCTIVALYRLLVVSSVSKRIKKKRLAVELLLWSIISIPSMFYIIIDAAATSTEHDSYCYHLQESVQQGINSEKNSTIFNNMQCRLQYQNWQ